MYFQSRSFWHPKDVEFASEYEDAFAVGGNGVAAIGDGVSSAIFSRQWASILTQCVVEDPPDLSDGDHFQQWLAEARRRWTEAIDLSKMNYFQRQKLQQVGGAYSTLLWVELYPHTSDNGEFTDRYRMRSFAIGDCCLFHVRDRQVLSSFPLDTVAEFEEDPMTLCSRNRNRDHLLEFQAIDDECQPGDLLVLSSDALAKWAYQKFAAEQSVDWDHFWEMSGQEWTDLVAELRGLPSDQRARVDDTTLVMLRLVQPASLESTDEDSELIVMDVIAPVLPGEETSEETVLDAEEGTTAADDVRDVEQEPVGVDAQVDQQPGEVTDQQADAAVWSDQDEAGPDERDDADDETGEEEKPDEPGKAAPQLEETHESEPAQADEQAPLSDSDDVVEAETPVAEMSPADAALSPSIPDDGAAPGLDESRATVNAEVVDAQPQDVLQEERGAEQDEEIAESEAASSDETESRKTAEFDGPPEDALNAAGNERE